MPFQPRSSKLSNKKYLIFDFDETISTLLIDWNDGYREGIVSAIQKYDPSFTLSPHQLNRKWVNFELENRFIEHFGQSLRKDLIEFHRVFEKTHYTGCEPNSAVIEFIRSSRGFSIFLWSNNHSETIKRALADLNLTEKIDRWVTCEQVLFSKPHPEGFSLLQIPNTALKEYLFIGDSSNDEKAAAKIGLDYLHVDDFVRLIKK
ncbi:MAG: hypothetical protein UY13_C0002G0076 [Candidatus Pacebacteria bacterium GW2011_GWB1_47_8]|nr:MAG: hypothetical protein UX28_C0001G0224 [Candidatus Pacebacteria bacterium GW2011_GWA1_46_10]KKU84164.1 MAG: hypothetical protein UY13_C0002G0076 [Candidatus Pacebacteria bacterium GW2011_GWB1_47_8]